ncbi:beta-ketoacyl-[acyl-carrier-protein] synthase family protein [Streptomyces niveiscabiei]|uniref:beta-ketoacyl-[acyl-carrier-protein] synthase family protein n=1 Tax=Streptomyces niveiscabiei TaxID=164115 RepID=UPI0029B32EE3|nr:beta-ketoacyl-[acyl-carrier-protein] synthase family protein [Streptomyces niveiscabiei]MDX3386038.1 beta-ketoacyl-[acyl-carrier-protein] synthase family protein [Streptomyces niveiscabiei]
MTRPGAPCAAVTGLGMITPAGVGWEETWRGVLAGRSMAATDPALAGLPVDFCCRVPDFDAHALVGKGAGRLDRFSQLAVAAARLAVVDAGLDPTAWAADRVGVVVGVGLPSLETFQNEWVKLHAGQYHTVSPLTLPRSLPNMAAGEIGIRVGARGPNLTVSTACASGATALGVALDLLRAGRCDIVLAGGTEAGLTARLLVLAGSQMRALSSRRDDPAAASRPFDTDRDGFVMAEGAAVLVLERPEHALARRAARVRARVLGYGASADAHHPTAPDPSGEGVALALRAALADADLRPGHIDHVNAHGTSTRLNDLVESRVLNQVFPHAPPVTSNKGVLGHALGAAGAIEAACSVLSLEQQVIPPVANLDSLDPEIALDVVSKVPRPVRMDHVISTSYGFGGQNAVLALGR